MQLPPDREQIRINSQAARGGDRQTATEIPLHSVRISGGDYIYTQGGIVVPTVDPYFKGATCTRTAYLEVTDAFDMAEALALAGIAFRLVSRSTQPSLSPPVAFSLLAGVTAGPANGTNASRFDESEVCHDKNPLPATHLIPPQPVTPAPTDRPGPLSCVDPEPVVAQGSRPAHRFRPQRSALDSGRRCVILIT